MKDIIFTLEETVENHRKLWREIARILKEEDGYYTVNNIKEIAMENIFPEYVGKISKNCFLCHYSESYCDSLCPLYKHGKYPFKCLNGLWEIFYDLIEKKSYKTAAKTALKIANLPIIDKENNKNEIQY